METINQIFYRINGQIDLSGKEFTIASPFHSVNLVEYNHMIIIDKTSYLPNIPVMCFHLVLIWCLFLIQFITKLKVSYSYTDVSKSNNSPAVLFFWLIIDIRRLPNSWLIYNQLSVISFSSNNHQLVARTSSICRLFKSQWISRW